jgi:hypothetical protein
LPSRGDHTLQWQAGIVGEHSTCLAMRTLLRKGIRRSPVLVDTVKG